MSTPEEEVRRRLLGEGESANYGQELLAQAQSMDPAEARKMLESAGFGVARPPSADEQRAMDQSRDYPANTATGFTPPPPVSEPDLSRPVDRQPRRRGRTRGEIKFRGGNKEPRDPNVMTAGDVFRASIGGPQYDEDVDTLSAGDIYRASVGANREPAPTAQEIYGDVDIPGTIARGISGFLNPPPRDPGSTRGGRKARAADEPEPTGTRPVPTQGEAPAADNSARMENQTGYGDPMLDEMARRETVRVTEADVTPEMRARQRALYESGELEPGITFPVTSSAQEIRDSIVPGTMVAAPPGERPEESQVSDQAEPGQASGSESGAPQIPEGGLNRVRIHRMMGRNRGVTDAIVDAPGTGLSGLEGPAGLSDQDLVKFARLKAQGIEGTDAQNLLQLQRRVDAEVQRANAGMINARSRAFFPFKTAQGTVIAQVDENGDIGFVQTDLQELLEPRVGNVVTDNGITRTSNPTLLYPTYDGYGNPTGAVGGLDLSGYMGPDPNSERAVAVQNFIDMALQQGASAQEIQEQLDMRFGFVEELEE